MKRAHSEDQKFTRRQEILLAAEKLFTEQHGNFPTVSAICKHSNLAKGTVYLYFKSKEEIYLALLEQYYREWLDTERLNKSITSIESIITIILNFIEKSPNRYRLIVQNHLLETNSSPQVLLAFKQNLLILLNEFALAISKNLQCSTKQATQWLLDSYAYLQGLWQVSQPSQNVATVLQENNLEVFMPNFKENAQRVLILLWHHLKSEQKSKLIE